MDEFRKGVLLAGVLFLLCRALYEVIAKPQFLKGKKTEGDDRTSSQEQAELEQSIRDFLQHRISKVKIYLRNAGNFWKNYQIEFYDNNNQKIVLDPYDGDPTNIINFYEKNSNQTDLGVSKIQTQIYFDDEPYTYFRAIRDTFSLLSPLFIVGFVIFMFKRTSPETLINSITQGRKNLKIQPQKNLKVKFDDVAGMEQAKKQVTQFVDFLKHSQKYIDIGAKIPKGALLTGPPGTGKTMLAKACAGEAGVSFFYISGSEFVEQFVGMGASKVRQLFAKARQDAPSIIFIDQIDAVGKKRENSRNEEKDSTLNQLLVEMDGFSSTETVIVLAASNRKDVLDSALTRPGRFDRMVQINLPDLEARKEIFKVHLKPLKIDPETETETLAKRLAELSPGFSGADISNLCNQAAIIATRKNNPFVQDKDFEEAAERITAGYQKKSLVTPKTKKRVAHHEAGHAVAGWFLRGGDPLVKLTIIPRSKGALGYAQYLPKQSFIKTKDELIDQVSIMLGGIISEEIFYGNMSSGGSDDLQKVYGLTRKMIAEFGMGKSTYNITMDEQTYIRKESQYLADVVDEEIQAVLEEAKKRCRNILLEKKHVIESLAGELIQKETLNNEDILRIMGPRPEFQSVSA